MSKLIGVITGNNSVNGITLVTTGLFCGVSLYGLTITGMIVVDVLKNIFS